jgi:hypothetical protein
MKMACVRQWSAKFGAAAASSTQSASVLILMRKQTPMSDDLDLGIVHVLELFAIPAARWLDGHKRPADRPYEPREPHRADRRLPQTKYKSDVMSRKHGSLSAVYGVMYMVESEKSF